jgi:PAS domain-containing protein
VNDYHASEGRRGLPEGHVALCRFMSVPIFQAGRIAYVYCVGNKAVDYDAFDLANLQLLTSEVDLLLGHRAAKRKLMDNEARLRQAMAAGGLGAWDWDLASGRLSWDEQTAIVVGSPTSAGSTYAEFIKHIHPEDLPMVDRALEKARRSGSDFRLEARIIWPDGTEHWLAVNGRALRDPAGVPHGMLGVVQEITDRKRAEEKLKQQLEELSRWHEVMLSREGRVQELKREVNDLSRRLRRPIPYASQDLNDHLEQLNPVRLHRNALR